MKLTLSILCLMLITSLAKAENVILNRIEFNGRERMDFLVSRDELRKVRPWEPEDGKAIQLSRDQALAIARKAAAEYRSSINDESKLVISLTKTNPFESELIKSLPADGCRWFFLIEFEGDDAALKGKSTFLVTMSGAVATKEIKQV